MIPVGAKSGLRTVNALEKIVRPIVEGQIRGFLKEHPKVLEGVDWYAPRTDRAVTFVNSLAKRIVCDLVCGTTLLRIEAALLETSPGESQSANGAMGQCRAGVPTAIVHGRDASPSAAVAGQEG